MRKNKSETGIALRRVMWKTAIYLAEKVRIAARGIERKYQYNE